MISILINFSHPEGPYGDLHAALLRAGDQVLRIAAPPERFARGLARALDDSAPFARHAVGPDARAALVGSALLPTRAFQRLIGRALRLPRPDAHRDDEARMRSLRPVEDRDPAG